MRLIDADEINTEDAIGGKNEFANDIMVAMKNLIYKQPTAYDADKITKELEEHFNATDNADMRLAYHHAIQIVKRGGVN